MYLTELQPDQLMKYDALIVASLPDVVPRYLNFATGHGTSLITVAAISMGGFSLGARNAPRYRDMKAHSILVARTLLYGNCI